MSASHRSRFDEEVERVQAVRGRRYVEASALALFSRARTVIAGLAEPAEDPVRMVDRIISEMEETLVEVRASAARIIADQKELQRHRGKLERLKEDWANKAELALSKGRDDLARGALGEKRKAAELAAQLGGEIAALDASLRSYEADIAQVQERVREARSRRSEIARRLETAENRAKLRRLLGSGRADEALARFEQLERRADRAEGQAEALGLADRSMAPHLSDEIDGLASPLDAELEQMKRALRHKEGN